MCRPVPHQNPATAVAVSDATIGGLCHISLAMLYRNNVASTKDVRCPHFLPLTETAREVLEGRREVEERFS